MRCRLRSRAILLAALAMPGWASGVEVATERAGGSRLAERLVHDDADLVLVVSGEQRGVVGPCGCGVRPLGGLERQQAYVTALQKVGPPVAVLHAGAWLDSTADGGEVTAPARAANQAIVEALAAVRIDALNVGWRDLAGLGSVPPRVVTANLKSPNELPDLLTVSAGEHTVAITGVSRRGPSYLFPEDAHFVEPVAAVEQLLPRAAEAALFVVLVYDDPEAAVALAALDGVDLVVEAAGYQARWAAVADKAVRVRTWDQGTRLTELRLWLGDEGLARVLHREVDLDEQLLKGAKRGSKR